MSNAFVALRAPNLCTSTSFYSCSNGASSPFAKSRVLSSEILLSVKRESQIDQLNKDIFFLWLKWTKFKQQKVLPYITLYSEFINRVISPATKLSFDHVMAQRASQGVLFRTLSYQVSRALFNPRQQSYGVFSTQTVCEKESFFLSCFFIPFFPPEFRETRVEYLLLVVASSPSFSEAICRPSCYFCLPH